MLEGTVYTAIALDEAEMLAVTEKFSNLLEDVVSLTQEIDPSLLGGMRVVVGGRVFDNSLKSQLEQLKQQMILDSHSMAQKRESEQAADAEQEKLLALHLAEEAPAPTVRAVGQVLRVGDGIAKVSGMVGCRYGELVDLCGGVHGIAMNLNQDDVDVVLLAQDEAVHVGGDAQGTGSVLHVPVDDTVLGRVLDPLGRPVDGRGDIISQKSRPMEAPAPAIIDRQPVQKPLETGVLAIDATVPIGRGQRELIIGDRQTGKSSVAIDAILNQKGKDVYCVYVAIGQKASTVAQVIEVLRQGGAMDYTVVILAAASDSPTMQYIAPYCGCAIAEEFMYSGRDVLVVYDDLSKHAVAYRAMSLLLRRPPGREAYPGDIFYLHSRLLERAAHLSDALGGGSMTALPIIETQTGDISAYIPTNVISITDGQIFMDADLFHAGTRPAINEGLSVSRVGGAAQTRAMRKVSAQLRLELAQYREMLVFSQFSSEMDATTQDMLSYGERLSEMLKQRNNAPLAPGIQVMLLYAMSRGVLPHDIPMALLQQFKREFPEWVEMFHPELQQALNDHKDLPEALEEQIRGAVEEWLSLRVAK